jgi:hypothetical protein
MAQRFDLLLNPRVAWTLACVCRTCKGTGAGPSSGACPVCLGATVERFEFTSADELRAFVEPLPDERVTEIGEPPKE